MTNTLDDNINMGSIPPVIKLLLIEDNPGDAILLKEMLLTAGIRFKLKQTETLKEGLEYIGSEDFDLLFLDLNLPDSIGIQTVTSVLKSYPKLPVVVLTGLQDEEFGAKAVHEGAQDYLNKAQLSHELLNKVIIHSIERQHLKLELHKRVQELKESRDELEVRVDERTKDLKADITKRKRIEVALKESEQRYRLLVENINLGISLIDTNYKVIMCNHQQAKLFGKETSDIVGSSCFKYYMQRTEVCTNCPGTLCMQTGRPEEVECLSELKDGILCSVNIKAFPTHDTNRSITGFIVVMEDVTDKKRVEAELLKTRKLESLGVLAGGIAHDFNNLLTGIIGNISLLAHNCSNKDGDTHKRLLTVENVALQAKSLTQQLLTFSKGGQPVKKPIVIGDLVRESTSFALGGSNVSCAFSIPDDLWSVDADKGQIGQVVNNLVINAVQAMPEGGQLLTSAENCILTKGVKQSTNKARYIRLSFKDEGIGIPTERLPKVFDPYFTTKATGSGLGLASSYSIVKRHGGYIEVDSSVGVGTTFFIYLPASKQDAVVTPETNTITKSPASDNSRVLVMDDDEIIRDVATKILTSTGYEVITATGGGEAIKSYKEAKDRNEPFDVVIMDLTIPGGIGGKEALTKILEFDPSAKVIVSSGYSNDPIMADFRKYGFSGVITKPYKATELSTIVHSIITGAD